MTGNEHVVGLSSFQHCADGQPVAFGDGQIFEAVNGQIYVTGAQGGLDLGREKALATDFGQRAIEFTVGLPAGELTGTGAESQCEIRITYHVSLNLQAEEFSDYTSVEIAITLSGMLFQADGGFVQKLVDQSVSQRTDDLTFSITQVP
jgi:hypothetical protein